MLETVEIDIWGSCVSRDSIGLGGRDSDIFVKNFFQGCSFPVQFTEHRLPDVKIEDYAEICSSNAHRKWACADINKTVVNTLDSSGSKWLVVDSRVMGYGVCKVHLDDGSYEYLTGDISNTALPRLKPYNRDFEISEVDYLDLELVGALYLFTEWARKRYGNNIILVEVVETVQYLDHDGGVCVNTNPVPLHHIEAEAFFNKFFYEHTGCYVVRAPSVMLSDARHVWGLSPVHYLGEYYQYVYDSIHTIITCEPTRPIELLARLYNDVSYKIAQILAGSAKSERNSLERALDLAKNGDSEGAFKILDSLDSQGVAMSHVYRARIYRDGLGVKTDIQEAIKHMRLASDYGVSVAGNELFDLLWKEATLDSYREAAEIARRFTEHGDAGAMGRLGRAYRDGRGVNQDLDKAAEWMRKAADKKMGWARNELFDILAKINTPESNAEAFQVISKYAETMDAGAMGRLGRAYRDGRGVNQDLDKAAEWMRKAADIDKWWKKELDGLLN